MTPFFCARWECPRKADAVLVSAFFVSGSPDFIIFSLYPWRAMIFLSESVASRAERAMNETIFLS